MLGKDNGQYVLSADLVTRVNLLKASLGEEPVSLVRKLWGPGGVEEVEDDQELRMQEDRGGYGKSEETERVGRETDDRDVHTVDPRLPNKEEVNAHNVFHSPYRNWCFI